MTFIIIDAIKITGCIFVMTFILKATKNYDNLL